MRKYVFKIELQHDFALYQGFGALGSVVAGIRHSCSGYAGFWPWLLVAGLRRQENAPGKRKNVRLERKKERFGLQYKGSRLKK